MNEYEIQFFTVLAKVAPLPAPFEPSLDEGI